MPDNETVETVETADTAGKVDDSSEKGLKLFGTNLTKIPCMRTSLLNGYIGAIVGGLAGFFYTSKIKIGCHSAFASYWIVATGTWFTCRYKIHKEKKFWENVIQTVKEKKVKKDEYNIPAGVTKLFQNTDGSDNIPIEK